MQLLVVGLNHKTAPIDLRERLAMPGERAARVALELTGCSGIEEAVVLSTCNRVEFYMATEQGYGGELAAVEFLADYSGIEATEIRDHLYVYRDKSAVRHIFRVTSSLDSMVVGEPQITGQVKNAWRDAMDVDAIGPWVDKTMRQAFHVSKKVRAETAIGENAVSLAFVAVELGRQIFGDLTGKTALLLGAGKMSSLAARHLRGQGARLVITNRSAARAEKLAQRLGGAARPLESLPQLLTDADVVISSTSATNWVLTYETIKGIVRARRNRPLFMIDLAVPRDIEPRVHNIDNVYLYDVDDMEQVLEQNRNTRQEEAEVASRIVDSETNRFMRRLRQRDVVPTIVALREHFHQIAADEVDRIGAAGFDADQLDVIEKMSQRLVNKLLHQPTINLKKLAEGPDGTASAELLSRLFSLPDEEEEDDAQKGVVVQLDAKRASAK